MSMDNEQFEAIKSRAVVGIELINTLDPYVTGNGGIVLLYGPYSPVKAQSIADYYRRLSTDVPALIAEVERLRAANARLVEACKEAVEWFEVYADEYPAHGRRVEAKLMAAVEQVENEATE